MPEELPERLIEELTLNALPALQTLHYDGWLLRFAAGHTRRANAVTPLYESRLPAAEKIPYCERLYRQAGLPVVFRLLSFGDPALDAALAERGYILTDSNAVLIHHDLKRLPAPAEIAGTTLRSAQTAETRWFDDYARLSDLPPARSAAMREMLARIMPQHVYLALEQAGEPVALALGVLEHNWVGVFNVVTRREQRRQGLGAALMLHLLAWGREHGAGQAYLQVAQGNMPALRLYARLGFREGYRYWYRSPAG